MPYVKGESGNPAGRPTGSQNRSTSALREVIAQLLDDNLDHMSDWLNRIAVDDPKTAFQCMLSLLEFNMPKMSRVTWVDEAKEAEASQKSSTMSSAVWIDEALAEIERMREQKLI
jgi:hypothetical protein